MIRDLLRWVAPGVVTILGGTIAALAMTAPEMSADLARQARAGLDSHAISWARIHLDGRDAHLGGTVDSPARRDDAVSMLAAVPGIRHVVDGVTIAPLVSPYIINVEVEQGAISLSGSVPNSELYDSLRARPDISVADLAIRSGQPDEEAWRAGLDFALAQASLVETGTFQLSGLILDMSGRANSQRALGALQLALAERPESLSLGKIAVEPVRAAPYKWQAEFDGARIAISGHVPDEQLAERFRTADLSGLPVATGLSLASGAPDNFAELSRLLVEQLARLEHGSASIVDGVSRLSGAPPSVEVAQAVTEALSGSGSIVQLSPPRIGDYWMSVTRQEGGVLVFDGYAPDEATRAAFSGIADADVSFLKLGSGAPETYRSAVDFGLSLLDHMSEGRIALNGSALSVSGLAETSDDYRAIRSLLDTGVPQGVTLAASDLRAPRAAHYSFGLSRNDDGIVQLSGMLPSPEIERDVLAAAGPGAGSDVEYASGEPRNFTAAIDQARVFLPWLSVGQVAFDDGTWTISGTPASTIDKGAIETEFAIRGLAAAGWTLDLTEPGLPVAQAEEPVPTQPDDTASAAPEEQPAPVVPEEAPAPAAPEPASPPAQPQDASPSAPAQLALCRDRVAELSAHNAILFQSGAAIIADSANAELDLFAEALALCPEAIVHVEGHTDSDGDDQRNLALSVARAEAVVNALIERGVDFTRLYAIGYGESQPVADNATSDGKRQNRRIVVTVHDPDE